MPIATTEAAVRIGFRWMLLALLSALCLVSETLPVLAQQETNVRGQPDTLAQRLAPEDRDAAARAEADRLEGLGGEPDALLGAPTTPGDPYGAAFDTQRRSDRALTHTERVPRGALENARDGQRQPVGSLKRPRPGMPADEATGKAKIDKADPGTHSAAESALSIYHGSGDVGKAVGEVYKMPW